MADAAVFASLLLVSLVALRGPTVVWASDDEEPKSPVCRFFAKNSLPFCSMVDYYAVVDQDDVDGSVFDGKAKFYYENVNVVLQRFGCNQRYALYGCDDCRDAYKYWICSIKFQRCGEFDPADGSALQHHHTLCPFKQPSPVPVSILEAATETRFFSANISNCNKMDRETNPDRPGPWPGTFADL
ncbi:hypothetical protein P43SY_006582 [Pythium insidiosum]|uniref:Uncharacterized protein n=1 Tax=Pythium insidiosum TaxID=114742 RepID=A0AAD5Q931_PYTIN|nr:hypothetical protein P43SY_006582 [Pythium insidiosum]